MLVIVWVVVLPVLVGPGQPGTGTNRGEGFNGTGLWGGGEHQGCPARFLEGGIENDLDAAVLLLLEFLVVGRCLIK